MPAAQPSEWDKAQLLKFRLWKWCCHGVVVFGLFSLVVSPFSSKMMDDMKNETETWPETTGVVTISRIDTLERDHAFDRDKFTTVVEVEYEVDGTTYRTDDIYRIGLQAFDDKGKADSLRRDFRKGETVPVFYNPERVKEAVLRRGSNREKIFNPMFGIAMGAGMIAVGLLGSIILSSMVELKMSQYEDEPVVRRKPSRPALKVRSADTDQTGTDRKQNESFADAYSNLDSARFFASRSDS